MGPIRFEENDVGGLHDLCNELVKDKLVVELGSYWGESMIIFAQYARRVYCIDPWVDVEENGATADGSSFRYEDMVEAEAHFDINATTVDNVVKIRGYSDHLAEVFGNNRIDVVYIDSLHHYPHVRRDINKWWRIVKPGGWLTGHNYGPFWPGVTKAVDESFTKPDRTYRDSSWAVQKQPGRKNA